MLLNSSPLPIYRVRVGLAELNDDESYMTDYVREFSTVPPGEHRVFYNEFEPTYGYLEQMELKSASPPQRMKLSTCA